MTLASVIVSIFFLGVSGTYYYLLIEALERRRTDTQRFLGPADATFALGVLLLMLEPALILFTLRFDDIGGLAIALWAISVVIIARGRSELLGGRVAVAR